MKDWLEKERLKVRRIFVIPLLVGILCLTPREVLRPELPQSIKLQASDPVIQSRGESSKVERRIMKVTAYTANDKGMDGKGVTSSGELVQEGQTNAIEFGVWELEVWIKK